MLIGLYWFAAILGVGVVTIDMLGLLGGDDGGDGGDGGDAGGDGGDAGGDGADGEGDGEEGGEGGGGFTVLSILRYLRIFIYFCLGFGPIGLASNAFGSGYAVSLLWAVGCGGASAVLANLFFRFQRSDLDSSVREADLLFSKAEVTVPIPEGGMGKVRVQIGQVIAERYAQAENENESFARGEIVTVSNVEDDRIFVSRDGGALTDL